MEFGCAFFWIQKVLGLTSLVKRTFTTYFSNPVLKKLLVIFGADKGTM